MTTTAIANAIRVDEAGFTFIALAFRNRVTNETKWTAHFYMAGDVMDYYNTELVDMVFDTFDEAQAYCLNAINNTLESAYCKLYDL